MRILLLTLLLAPFGVFAQTVIPEGPELTRQLWKIDSIFFDAYNRCDVATSRRYLDPNLEFYHDQSGVTRGVDDLIRSTEKYICGLDKPVGERVKVRRALVPATFKVYPMKGYGALVSYEHWFYQTAPGQKERLTGKALATTLWQLTPEGWHMSRIISYDHRGVE